MRILIAAALAASAAAGPLLAQKPGAEPDPERERYRGQGISLCVAEMNALEGVTPDESEAICGCALERFMANRPTGALVPLGDGQLRVAAGSRVLACAMSEAPARAGAVSRWMAAAAPAPVVEPLPTAADEGGKPVATEDGSEPEADRRSWFEGLTLPRWLRDSSLPLWAWIPLLVFVFLFLRGLFRRGEGRDLDGPPPSMRRRP